MLQMNSTIIAVFCPPELIPESIIIFLWCKSGQSIPTLFHSRCWPALGLIYLPVERPLIALSLIELCLFKGYSAIFRRHLTCLQRKSFRRYELVSPQNANRSRLNGDFFKLDPPAIVFISKQKGVINWIFLGFNLYRKKTSFHVGDRIRVYTSALEVLMKQSEC